MGQEGDGVRACALPTVSPPVPEDCRQKQAPPCTRFVVCESQMKEHCHGEALHRVKASGFWAALWLVSFFNTVAEIHTC